MRSPIGNQLPRMIDVRSQIHEERVSACISPDCLTPRAAPGNSSPMRWQGTAAAVLTVILVAACGARQHGGTSIQEQQREERLARMEARLSQLEEQMARIAQLAERLGQGLGQLDAIATQLDQIGAAPSARQRPPRADPDAVYAVPVGDSPFEGPADAKVTIVEAFEFACPFCERSRATMRAIRQRYGKDVRIVHKNFLVHPDVAVAPALAACAADAQGKYMPMREAIWEKGYNAGRDLSADNMRAIARSLELNMTRFERDMEGDACKQRIMEEQAQVSRVGTRGTPTFYINGRILTGAQPLPSFVRLIDEELAKANEAIAKEGIAKGDYYQRIVESGRTSL